MSCLQRLFRFSVQSCATITKRFNSNQPINQVSFKYNQFNPSIITVVKNPWVWQKQTNIETPNIKITPIELPRSIFWVPPLDDAEKSTKIIEAPATRESKIEKQAVRLIVIRRHKMRKHKLKKLRKKMKFEWAKRRQRREMAKEKAFQGQLLAQIKEAENFNAEQFVNEKIRKATEVPIPRFWKGKRLPEFVIREKLGLPPK